MLRVLSGAVLAAAFVAIVWFSSAAVLVWIAMGVSALAFREYAALMERLGVAVPRIPTLAATLATVVFVPFPFVAAEAVLWLGLVVIAVAAMAGVNQSEGAFVRALHATSAGVLAVVYLGLPLGALVGVHIYGGRGAVLLLVVTIIVSDTAQYYSGRLLGRRPLAARLSPKKTIEGAVGGFVFAPIFLYFAGPYWIPVASPMTIAPLGFALVAAGIAGDLFESLLKRAADMKDSSALIPGHGGVLDRIDALLFATPLFYVYVRWVYTA